MTNEQPTKGNTMTHKATRNYNGSYTYRGSLLERVEADYNPQGFEWTITPEGSDEIADRQDTLRDAKEAVDFISTLQFVRYEN